VVFEEGEKQDEDVNRLPPLPPEFMQRSRMSQREGEEEENKPKKNSRAARTPISVSNFLY
jgi:hypothetical protein